jgi:uncharacterized protein
LQQHDPFVAPIAADLSFDREGKNILVDVNPIVRSSFSVIVAPSPLTAKSYEQVRLLITADRELNGEQDDLVFVVSEYEQEVDLTDPLRESLILSLPIKRLCSENCQGLCPYCGVNRNVEICNCMSQTTDHRWDQLKDLFKSN